MDKNNYVRSAFAHMPSNVGVNSCSHNKETCLKEKKEHSSRNEKNCTGDILFLNNPLFTNVALNSKDKNTKSCKFTPIINDSNNIIDNYFHKLFSWNDNLQNSQIPWHEINKKSRKDGMKARAETRRDILLNESSDEDYSSRNSINDLRSPIKTHNNLSLNMDDVYNRKSRSARTERYFRRLSRDDNFYDQDTAAVNHKISSPPNKVQEVIFPIGTSGAQSLANSGFNNPGERRSHSSFFNQDDYVLQNPIYKTSKTKSPMFYDKQNLRQTTENRSYGGNLEYSKERKSQTGGEGILEYKGNKLTRPFDRLQYIEPQIHLGYQKITPQDRQFTDPKRIVGRSYSFQSKTPKGYENRNDVFDATICRAPITRNSKSGNNSSSNNSRAIDSTLSSTSPTLDLNIGTLYPQKEKLEFKASDKNLTKTYESSSTEQPTIFRNENNISLNKKRNSKDLGKELSELEEMYTSLRLSDDNLLERAEERCVEELTLKGRTLQESSSKYLSSSSSSDSILGEEDIKKEEKYSEAHVRNDDMAYRKMRFKNMPALSETQNSLSQISYLLASSALILGENDYPDFGQKLSKEEPNVTKDDMVYRNLHYANNVLKVVEPQPPFGIPLRPATPSTNSNYLCSTPVAVKSPPLKFIPQSEPNLITDDLAFRNLRKDTPKTPPILQQDDSRDNVNNHFSFSENNLEESLSDDKFFRKKKKAVRSLSANLYGLIREVNNLELNIK